MMPMSPLLSLIWILPLIAFWLVMFRDMLQRRELPPIMTVDAKTDGTLAFVIFNVFTAAFYYATVYRNRR